MPRHRLPKGYGKGKRGRHKRRGSMETKTWETEHTPPEKPPWMDQQTYQKLMQLRDA
jgi:hypothetical protein